MQDNGIGVNTYLGLTFKMLTEQTKTRATIYSKICTYLGSEKNI